MPETSLLPPVKPLRDGCFLALTVFAIASSSLLISYRVSRHLLLTNAKSRLSDLVSITAADINADLHSSITSPTLMGGKLYREATEPLIKLRKKVPDLHYAYTLRLSSNNLYFVLDSSYFTRRLGDETDVASVGQPYQDAPSAAFVAATTGQISISDQPYTDRWGTFLSGFAPIKSSDGDTVGILGIDFSLAFLNRQLKPLRLATGLLLCASGLLSALVGLIVWQSGCSRRRAFEDILKARDLSDTAEIKIDEANRVKSTFLATLGHEIRTPLNGIIGLTNILLHTSLTSEQQECLQTVKNSGESLLLQLNQLIDFAAIESSSISVEIAPIRIHEFLHDIMASFSATSTSKNISTSLKISTNIPDIVLTDPTHLRHILEHLLGNAIKFTSNGLVELSVSCQSPLSDDTLPLLFCVRDSGSGLSDMEPEHIFQPFRQGDSSSTQVHGGLGLGLAICRGLVTALGGTIEVESSAGSGTAFLVTIPVIPTSEPVINSPSPVDPPTQSLDSFAKDHPLRILLVDDNPVNIRVCELMLGRLGYVASIACDGEEAVVKQQTLDPDLILMDIRMPKIDGLEATRRIRSYCGQNQRPWIAAVTANSRESDRVEALTSGMNDFISKPIRVERLRSVLLRAHAAIRVG